jgi:diguanylate cyclase (GGDEF)-like protein
VNLQNDLVLARESMRHASDATREITLSMGVAIAEPGFDFKIEALLAKADAGLYEAKRQGRNRVAHLASASVLAGMGKPDNGR